MNAAFVIAGKDLRERLRDKSALVVGFLAPVVVAALISFAFAGMAFHATVTVVDADRGPLATAFTAYLDAPELQRAPYLRGHRCPAQNAGPVATVQA